MVSGYTISLHPALSHETFTSYHNLAPLNLSFCSRYESKTLYPFLEITIEEHFKSKSNQDFAGYYHIIILDIFLKIFVILLQIMLWLSWGHVIKQAEI